jgi:hypothetical protein
MQYRVVLVGGKLGGSRDHTHSNKEIAEKVGRSVPTVEWRLTRIRKLWEKEVGP